MKIDSHHHLWTLARGDYDWLSPVLPELYRDFTAKDMAPLLAKAGIDKTIVVQAAPAIAETEFLLQTDARTSWIAGVVGWVDMEAKTVLADIDRLCRYTAFKGIRPMVQRMQDDDWLLRPDLDHVFDALVERGLTFDALILPQHLPQLLRRLEKHPELKSVINHAAKPALATQKLDIWMRDIARIAQNTHCLCKFSGLVTEAGTGFSIDTLRPAADHLLGIFGAERLMFGSDWPVLNLAADYAGWVEMAQSLCFSLNDAQKTRFWGGTAALFYDVV